MITKNFELDKFILRTKTNPSDWVSLPQATDTSLKIINSDFFFSRYLFLRAAETRNAGELNQDYLGFRYDRQKYVFVLCDGVSQSFFGELAAKFLGNKILNWLWELSFEKVESSDFYRMFNHYLNSQCGEATQDVLNHPLPINIPSLLQDVLEQKRKNGSETTFVCGRIDLPKGRDFDGFMRLSWMGDTRLRLWESSKRYLTELEGKFNTDQRWSSLKGLTNGEPQFYSAPFLKGGIPRFSLIEAYTDGFELLDRFKRPATNKEIRVLADKIQSLPTSDDISYLGIRPNAFGLKKISDLD